MDTPVEGGACAHCGERGNRAGAKFCLNCGGSLAPQPSKCPSCGESATAPGTRFCNSCGAPMSGDAGIEPLVAQAPAAEAPAAPAPRRSSPFLWIALLLAIGGGGAFVYQRFFASPEPRLIVWSDDDQGLDIQVQAGANIPRDPQGGYSPPPGPCVVTVSRQGKPVETHRFSILPAAVHLCVVGGAPIDASAGALKLSVRHPWSGALFGCDDCKLLNTSALCGGCRKARPPFSPRRELKFVRSSALESGNPAGRALIFINPYAADLKVDAKTSANSVSFPLPKESIRTLPYAESVAVKIASEPDGAALEEKELKPGPGVSLYTVGGATWFEWRGDGAAPDSGGTVVPEFLSLLKLDPASELLAPDAAGPGLLRRVTGGRLERLVPIFSQPLLAPAPGAPAKVVTHPGVEVAEVTLPAGLAGKSVEAVAAGDAGVIVVVDGSAHSLATGDRVHDAGPGIRSAALASDGLFLLTRQSTSATIDGRKIVTGPAVTDPTICAWAPRGGGSVFLHGGRYVRGLLIVTPQGPREVLPEYPPVTALGSTKEGVLVARGRTIERLTMIDGKAKLDPALVLPEGDPIVGLHDAGGPLVFSTEKGVYVLSDTLVLPIAQGVGGALYPCKGGVLLHDRASRRLYRIKSPLFRES